MKIIRKTIAFLTMLMMLSTIIHAEETKDVSYKVTVEGENVSVVEDSLTSETDYSDLIVNVIKDTNGQQTTIYSGVLGGYADGAFADVDFSEINFMVIFDWNTMEEEAIYIIPTNAVNTVSETQSNMFMSLQSEESEFFRLEDALETEDTSGVIPKKIYDVNLLPSDYLEYMTELGSETGNYGDDSVPAPAVSYDYEITAINLRDDEDNSADYLVNGGVLQSVTVESNGVDDDVILAVAEYNGYTLTKLTSYDITLSNNKDVVMTNYTLSNITENTSIKLFVWDAYWGTNPKANPITLFTDNDMDISVNFIYDNEYTEKAFNRGETIKAQVNAKSTKWWSQAVNLYIALYDENNKLISLASTNSNIISDGNYQFIDVELPLAQDLPTGYIVKTFVWENQSMKPYLTNVTIVSTADYHADNIQNARYVNMSKAVSGIINTDTDKDFIKFIPTATQDYLIQLFGNEQLGINLYDSDGTIITTSDYYSSSTGTIIEQNLTKGKMYYIELSGTAQDEYTLTITPNTKATDNLQITGSGIIATGQADANQTLNAKLLSTTGNLVSVQEFSADETGNYAVNLPTNLLSGEYYFAISNANVVQKMWNVNALVNNCSFDTVQDEYCIVPVTVSNADNLENINFSVCYAVTDFELYDACDMTETIENTVMEISDELIDIVNIQPSFIVFKSLKTEFSEDDEIINIIKLKAKQSTSSTVSVCAYTIQ